MVTAGVQAGRVALMVLSQILLARLLAPADFGLIAMVAPVTAFVQILADLGITQAVVSVPKLSLRQINTFFWLNILLLLGLAAFVAALAPAIAWFYGEPRLTAIVLACAALIVIGGLALVQGALLNRFMMFGRIGTIDMMALAVSVLVGFAAALNGWGYWSLIVSQAAFSITATGLTMIFAPWRPTWPQWDPSVLALLRFGGAVTGANLVNYINVSVDNVIIGVGLGRVPLGYYDRAWKLAVQPVNQIQAPFGRVAIPALSRLAHDGPGYRSSFLGMMQILLAFSTPTMICAAMVAEPLIVLALGERWLPIVAPFILLCLAGVLTPINGAAFWLLVTQGRVGEQFRLSVATSAINIAAYGIGVRFGVTGLVAISLASVLLLQTPLLLGQAVRSGPVRGRDIAPILLANGIAGLAAAGGVFALRAILGGVPLLLAAPLVALGCNFAVLFAWPSTRVYMLAGYRLGRTALRRARPPQPVVTDAV